MMQGPMHRRRLASGIGLLVLLTPVLAWAAPSSFDSLVSRGWIWAYLGVFAAGFLTSLTPCVYPMIPITLAIFGAKGQSVSRGRAFFLASMYVLGMGVTYSTLGTVVALLGGQFGTVLSKPSFVIPLVAFFVLLAAWMFGIYELGLPSGLQERLNRVGGKGTGGAFAMGLVGGLIAAPCTGPILAGILAFVATTRNVPLGFSLLFTYAVGMGVLFWGIAAFALALPKSGAWMESVKSVMGLVLLGAAVYFLRPIWPALVRATSPSFAFLGVATGLVAAGIAVGAVHLSFHGSVKAKLRKGVGIFLTVAGLVAGVNWFLTPKRELDWRTDEKAALAEAREQGRPMLIDFGASWCLPCKEYEVKIFADPLVHEELEARFVPLKFDVSKGTDADFDAQARWKAKELPSVILLGSDGKEVGRFGEPLPTPDEFLTALKAAQ